MRFELLCAGCMRRGGDCPMVACGNPGCEVEVLSCLAFSGDNDEQPFCSMACVTDDRLAREDSAIECRRAS